MSVRIPLIAANWKLHKTLAEAHDFLEKFREDLKLQDVDVVIAPSFLCLHSMAVALQASPIHLAAQNVYFEEKGAFTGEVSPAMLHDAGCHYVIIGHSERRAIFGEDDQLINQKVRAAFKSNLIPILCIGESLEQRQNGETEAVLERQLRANLEGVVPNQAAKLVVAYEPIWAIGTGQTASSDDAQAGCAFVRKVVEDIFNSDIAKSVRVQYGGSVKPDNARELLSQPDIDGALVGGASLEPDSFKAIMLAALA